MKKKLIFSAYLVMGILCLLDAVKGFAANNLWDGIKSLVFAIAVGGMGILYILPEKTKEGEGK